MILALSRVVKDRLKRDEGQELAQAPVLTAPWAGEQAYQQWLAQVSELEGAPVLRIDDWLASPEGLRAQRYPVYPKEDRDAYILHDHDLYYVHIRQDDGRESLYFCHSASGFAVGYQLGDYRFVGGRRSLLAIFYLALRRLGYSEETLRRYIEASPLVAFTTIGDRARRSWMNSIIDHHVWYAPWLDEGQRLLIQANLTDHDAISYLRRQRKAYQRKPGDIFADYYREVTGHLPERAVPAVEVTARLIDPEAEFQPMHHPWRRFVVPADASCENLGHLLMGALGLANTQSTEWIIFPAEGTRTTHLHEGSVYAEGFYRDDAESRHRSQVETPVRALLEEVPAGVFWNYDFGDDFWYQVELEPAEPLSRYHPQYVAGGYDSPPVGIGGYAAWEAFRRRPAERLNWAVRKANWRPYREGEIARYFSPLNPLARPAYYLADQQQLRSKLATALADELGLPEEGELSSGTPADPVSQLATGEVTQAEAYSYYSDASLAAYERLYTEGPLIHQQALEQLEAARLSPERTRNRFLGETLELATNLYGVLRPADLRELLLHLEPDRVPLSQRELDTLIGLGGLRSGQVQWSEANECFYSLVIHSDDEQTEALLTQLLAAQEETVRFNPDVEEAARYQRSLYPDPAAGAAATLHTLIATALERDGRAEELKRYLHTLYLPQVLGLSVELHEQAYHALGLGILLNPDESRQLATIWNPWQLELRRWTLQGHCYAELPQVEPVLLQFCVLGVSSAN